MKADGCWRSASDSFIVVLDGRRPSLDAMSLVSCSLMRFLLWTLLSCALALHTQKLSAMALAITSICRLFRYVYVSMYGNGHDTPY
jgi:hypothetical protein